MSNFLCLVSTKKLKNTIIYGAVLKEMQSIDSVSDELGYETMYYYAIETSLNYEKSSIAKIACPEAYSETEKMYRDIYELSGEILKSNGNVALFLTYVGRTTIDNVWETKNLPRENFNAEDLEFAFGVLYKIKF